MAIEMFNQNGFAWLTGVYEGQQYLEFLGSSALSKKIQYGYQGTFHIGFDNRIQPAQARVFYEPPPQAHEGARTIGLVQFCQYKFQGEPLPPEMYNPEIDYKNEYRDPVRFAQEQFWLDLMDLENAYKLMRPGGPLRPFYAYNGLLFPDDKKPEDFILYGSPNGSLLRVAQTERREYESLAASLIAPVGLDLDVLDDTAISKEVIRYQSMGQEPIFIAPYPPNDSETQNLDMIQYVLKLLNDKKQTLETNSSEKTPPIAEGDIRWVKVVGGYVMIQFDDPEYVGGLICVYTYQNQSATWITAYNFDAYTFERWVIEANTHMFERYIAYKKERQEFSSYIGNLDTPSRGRKPLRPSPFLEFKKQEQEIVVSFTYRTFGYVIEEKTPAILGGVEWEVSRKFDLADLQWGMLEFKEPQPYWITATNPPYDLKLYYEALRPATMSKIRKPGAPTIWFYNPAQIVTADRPVGFGERATNWIGM
jgi:hypothetical protein